MDAKLESLVAELEKESGQPVRITVEYASGKKKEYGEFSNRKLEVVSLPSDNPKVLHDLEFLKGEYSSLTHLVMRICELKNITDPEACRIAHCQLNTHEGVEMYLEGHNPQLKEAIEYLIANNLPFLWYATTPFSHGIYSEINGNSKKIANIKYEI